MSMFNDVHILIELKLFNMADNISEVLLELVKSE